LEGALKQLWVLDALDIDGGITPLGRQMVSLPLEPSLARALIAATQLGCLSQATTVAAMLSAESIFQGNRSGSDVHLMLDPSVKALSFITVMSRQGSLVRIPLFSTKITKTTKQRRWLLPCCLIRLSFQATGLQNHTALITMLLLPACLLLVPIPLFADATLLCTGCKGPTDCNAAF